MQGWKDAKLETIAGGKVCEQFNFQLARAIENCLDPNTEAVRKRSVVLRVSIKPNHDRTQAEVEFTAEAKLVTDAAGTDSIQFSNRGTAHVRDMEQMAFGIEEPARLVPQEGVSNDS